MATLPHDLIVEILLRLPVKSLLQFKCVCKLWFSLISNPQFAKSHFDIATPTHRLLVKFTDNFEFESLDMDAPFNDDSARALFKIPLASKYHWILRFEGSCRGFILMIDRYRQNLNLNFTTEFIVWNLATGFHRRINCVLESTYHCLSGLGYNSTSDEYVIVVITLGKSTKIHYFSLKTNLWNCIDHAVSYNLYSHFRPGFIHDCFLNGALHWLVKSHDNYGMIIAFDVKEKRLSEIVLPFDLANDVALELRSRIYTLRLLGGCLCLCSTNRQMARPEIWTMKKYKVQSSWTKKSLDLATHYRNDLFPICFTKNGELLASINDTELLRLSDTLKPLEHCKHWRQMVVFGVYRECLLSLPGESEEAMEDEQEQLTMDYDN